MSWLSEDDKEEWKNLLTDESREVLEGLLYLTKRHKGAYTQAEDVKISQLWTALIEMKKQLDETRELVGKLKEPWIAIVSVGEAEKRKVIERMVGDLIKPTSEDSQETTKKLLDTPIKF